MIGLVAWLMLPKSEGQLRSEAESLLEKKTRTNMRIAKNSYLNPLVERFPDGEHYEWAIGQIDEIEMAEAEYELDLRLKHGRPIRSEAARLYNNGRQLEQFGDTLSALETYENMITLIDSDTADGEANHRNRAYANLARRQIRQLESGDSLRIERRELVEKRLSEARQLADDGKMIQARKIWISIVSLFGNDQNMRTQVAEATERLDEISDR